MDEYYAVSYANLRYIERSLDNVSRSLGNVFDNINDLNNRIGRVDNNVEMVYGKVNYVEQSVAVVSSELNQLAKDFRDFAMMQIHANNLSKAQQRIIIIRQELEKRFGHYDIVRRTTTGILQADDLGIVKKSTITNATEEIMIQTPGYWLAPCLVALAAWINDQPELAERALKEAIKRNDEKTSLFFALICRRADRKGASVKWIQRYLANQDEESLDRKAIIILDAFASGLLGADSEGIVAGQMSEWLERISEKPGFVEQQTKQWSDAMRLKRKPIDASEYPYLRKFSATWPALEDVMEGARLHSTILDYFTDIFDQEVSIDSLKAQLDEILDNLVTGFDDEEIPLRKEEKFNQLVIDFEGDEDRAKQNMAIEETAFEERKDFSQLLTDAAMKPESSHASPSTQKFALALSKDWISNAYNDVVAQNRMKIPNEIEFKVDTFQDKTTDGKDEEELVKKHNLFVEKEKMFALASLTLMGVEKFCLWGGISAGITGIIMALTSHWPLGLLAIIAGLVMVINYSSKKKQLEQNRQAIIARYNAKKANNERIIRAILAEVVDFRAEFEEKDGESEKVLDFLEQISPDQYVRKLSDSNRRIKIK